MHIISRIILALLAAVFIEMLFDQLLIGYSFTKRGLIIGTIIILITLVP